MDATYLVCTILACATSVMTADEFPVHVRTAGKQANVAVAAERSGRFAVAWSSYFSTSGRSNDVIARRFDPNGSPAGEEFRVNAIREGNQTEPALAADERGFLLVAWQGPGGDGDEDIFARVFDPNDEPITNELCINADTMGRQLYPSVAARPDGTFVVAWESRQPNETIAIRGRLLENTGDTVGEEFAIGDGMWDCRYPDVAVDGTGGFATVWMQDRSSNTIFARLFDSNAVASTEPLAVSTAGIASVTRPSIAMSEAGGFVIVWDGDPRLASLDDIHGRCFGPDGTPRSDPFVVNSQREGRQQWPQVAVDGNQEFIVVWQHEHDDPNVATDIFAQRFGGDDRPAGGEFKLNGYVAGKQRYPAVALSGHGSAFVAWESDDQDGSDYGIFARIVPGADMNTDGAVDFRDLSVLGRSWRDAEHDLTGDNLVDARDLEVLSRHWLK